jgi:type VI protein secretion system component Hcp
MPIYMQYPGIPGTINTKEYPHWIELQSAQLGVGRGIGGPTGSNAHRETSTPNLSEVVVTKLNYIASTRLFQESLQGEGKTVTIAFVQNDQSGLKEYLRIVLENTIITSYQLSRGGGDQGSHMESMSLNFTKSKFVVKDQGPDAAGGP